jgi:thiosulfate/3-mercaptopyruvate sulfurtransferase
VAGHIPGARNRFNSDNLTPQGTFKDKETLKADFLAILGERSPSEAVHYCGSGVSACHNLLAMDIAGLHGGKLYAGSWSEWSADPNRPVAR